MKSLFASRLLNAATLGRMKYGWYDSAFRSNSPAIFSGASPRSGTTLLYSLLNAHDNIFVALETGLMSGARDLERIHGRTNLPVAELRRLYRRSSCYAEFTENVLSRLAGDAGKRRWGDKSPVNVTLIGGIFRYFPNARFIHIVRDGRDAVCSIRQHPPSFGNRYDINPWDKSIELWESWTRQGLAWRQDPRYFEIRYESLVNEPQRTLAQLFQWLGEPWQEDVLFKAKSTRVGSHPGISRPINKGSHGVWRKKLPQQARELFSGSANDLLVELGYVEDDVWIRG
ncbi:MAG TPA: sulfotransferase [Gammaproteobacteria bacterium]|nr:sulfotransferase [Gammaproteobacteria bacterium]